MSFQKLNEGRRVVSPTEGVTVECLSSFGRYEVRINVSYMEHGETNKVEQEASDEATEIKEEGCKNIALIAGGYIDPSFSVESTGHCSVYFNYASLINTSLDAISSCGQIIQDATHGEHTLFQVRYPVANILFYDDGTTQQHMDIVFSLCIIKGLELVEGPGDTIKNKVIVTATDLESLAYCVPEDEPFLLYEQEFDFDQFGLLDSTACSASFNADKTKLFIVLSTTPEETPDPPTCFINYVVYGRSMEGYRSDSLWVLESTGSYTPAYNVKSAYVDHTGTIWGLYTETIGGDGKTIYSYATVDIFTGTISAAAKCSIGFTIINGDFVGIFEARVHHGAETDPQSGLINQPGYCTYLTYVDDGVQLVDNSDPQCADVNLAYYCYYNCAYHPDCIRIRKFDRLATYWYAWDSYRCADNLLTQDITTVGIALNSTIGWEETKTYEGNTKAHVITNNPCYGGCAPAYTICILSTQTTTINNLWNESNKNESAGVIGGVINKGVSNNNGVSHDYTNSFTATQSPTYCNFLGTAYSYCGTGGTAVPYSTTTPSAIIHPFAVTDAIGSSSFIAWDNNVDGLVIKGLTYTINGDPTERKKITINDRDVTTELLVKTQFNDNFKYLRFPF